LISTILALVLLLLTWQLSPRGAEAFELLGQPRRSAGKKAMFDILGSLHLPPPALLENSNDSMALIGS
jgi:hypothetical protein